MNANEPDLPPAGPVNGSAEPAATDAPKPRRRRTTRAAPLPEAGALAAPADEPREGASVAPAAEAGPVEAAAAPAVKTRRVRRKKEATVEGPVDAPVDAMAGREGEPSSGAASVPAGAREARPAAAFGADKPLRANPLVDVPASTAAAGPGAYGGPPSAAAEGGEPAAGDGVPVAREGSRRGRNRRRNRNRDRQRDGDRGPGREAAADGDVQGGEPPRGPRPDGAEESFDDDEAAAAPLPALEPTDPGELFAEVVSGAYDAADPATDAQTAPTEPRRRVLAAEPDAPKLHKVLAQAGIGSRRDMEQWVLEGRVTVNGEPAHIGQRISFGDRIAVGGKPVRVRIAPPPPRVLAYHKPAGEVVTHDDPQHRPTVFRRLPRLPHGKWQSVGRLDINTEGLLLFTNSGELANQLMHPRFGVEREYAVRSLGLLDDAQRQQLLDGVEIDGQRAAFKSIDDGGGEGVNHWYRVVITEGRNREVRRLFEAVGHAVSRLIRIRYGCVVLPRGLKRGVWVDLPEPDVRALRRLTGTERPRDEDGPGGRNKRRRGRQRDGRGRENGPDRPPRAERQSGSERPPSAERQPGAEGEGPMHIPNPLQQTYDKRAIQQARTARRELTEDDPIPNPLQQTYDRRALQRDRAPAREPSEDGPIPNPLQQTYDKRFVQKAGGRGARGAGRAGGGPGGPQRQPDPMQTALGYIGADAFHGKRKGGRGGKPGGKGPGKGGGGGRGGGRSGGGGRPR